MKNSISKRRLSSEDIAIRKRYLGATFVTCIVVALVGGTIHVVNLGASRMEHFRQNASYDLEEEDKHIRAAGEDLFRNQFHEHRETHTTTFTIEEAEGLLPAKMWMKLEESVNIPSGQFTMGTNNLKTDAQNRPAHLVSTGSYNIDKYPITNSQYARFVAEVGRRVPLNWQKGKFDPKYVIHPVTMVTWFDAKAYCDWAGKRLPTEAEWEKAARSNDERRWPWGDVMDTKRLNTYYNVGSTSPVTNYENGKSPYGVMDMAGNVQEWVFDNFESYKHSDAPEVIFIGKKPVISDNKKDKKMKMADFVNTNQKYKVMRGGSWKGDPFSTSSYHRGYAWPNTTSDFFGFRCVSDANSQNKEASIDESSNNG